MGGKQTDLSVISPRGAPLLATLADEVLACRACEVAGSLIRAHPIPPALLADPRLMLIGQAPGAVTDARGYHFAGPAGAFLDQWFSRAGFPPDYFRQHVYLTSLTRCFPGKATSGGGDRPPSRSEIALCRPFLRRELDMLNPPLVVLVGRMAIDAFLPSKRPLTELIGNSVERDGRVWLPLPHASGVSRWLNAPANQALLGRAIDELGRLRKRLTLA